MRGSDLQFVGSRLKRAQLFARVPTVSAMLFFAVIPSPVAEISMLLAPKAAPCVAVSLKETIFVLVLDTGVRGFADHAAVTPLGRPLTEKLTFPANDPPVTTLS